MMYQPPDVNFFYLIICTTNNSLIMKTFISTKFFLALKEASQTGITMNTHVLKNCFDEFVILLFSQSAALTCKVSLLNSLDYTRIELITLTDEVSEKKCGCLFEKGYPLY